MSICSATIVFLGWERCELTLSIFTHDLAIRQILLSGNLLILLEELYPPNRTKDVRSPDQDGENKRIRCLLIENSELSVPSAQSATLP